MRIKPTILILCLTLSTAAVGAAGLIDIGSRKQLLWDEYLIESLKDTRFVMNPATKATNNPVISRDKPWEGNYLHYTTVFYDEQEKQFRLWYSNRHLKPVAEDNPIETSGGECYATSKDGFHWQKPVLGLVEFEGSKQNNILDEKHYSGFKGGIFIDPREEDPKKRYKGLVMSTVQSSRMRFDLYTSPDAFNWTPHPANPIIDWGDRKGRWGPTAMMGWDPIRQVYAAHMEICLHQSCPMGKRIIGRSESPDLMRWSDTEPIIAPDADDYPDTEFYSMWATTYEGFYVGMLWNFRTTNTTILPLLVYSRDGIHYDRRFRQPVITPSASPTFDSVAIYSLQPIVREDKIFLYYGGVNWRSPQQLELLGEEKAHGAIGLATVPLDGFVSLDGAKRTFSEVLTRSFGFSGKELRINMQASFKRWGAHETEVKVEVLGTNYHPIPGYSLEDADSLTEGGLDQLVTWRGRSDVRSLQDIPIKLRIHFKNAKLFSFRFSE